MATTEQHSSYHFSCSVGSAIIFTIGCVICLGNAVLSILPLVKPTVEYPRGIYILEGALSLCGSVLFVTGGILALIQVIKSNRKGTGREIYGKDSTPDVFDVQTKQPREISDEKSETSVSPPVIVDENWDEQFLSRTGTITTDQHFDRTAQLMHEVWTLYIHEGGFVGTFLILSGSTIFSASSIASVVSIIQDGEIWTWIRYPQIVGATAFAIASIILMIHHQESWKRPAWDNIRWVVSVLNLAGSVGFIVCACFGLIHDSPWAKYHLGMSYLWGSIFFLLASSIRWGKALGKQIAKRTKHHEKHDLEAP